MRTLTLLSILLAVTLGKPFEQQGPQVLPPETLQRPLVGDLLPVQGHVVEENPAPKPELGKEQKQTSLQVQEEPEKVPVEEAVMQDLTEDNEVAQVDEELRLESEVDGQDVEGLQANQEPKPEIMNDIVEGNGEEESVQEPEGYNEVESKYDFEQPIMKLEPLTNEEMQRDELLEASETNDTVEEDEEKESVQELEDHNEVESKYDFEQPIMKLEPLTNEEMQRDELLEASETKGEYEEPVMYLEPETVEGQFMNDENVPVADLMAMEEDGGPMLDALGEPLQLSDQYFLQDEGFMRLEPLESEEQSQMLQSMEPVESATGERYCSGVVLEGKCFQVFTNPKKASEAEYFCQESFYGGHLASITSQNIHNEMMNLMRQYGGTRRTWVGGLRFLETGRFVWLDGSRWDYADWLSGEPNDTAGVEDCIEVLASGKFNDFTCWEPQAFICSYPYQ